jgi:hypothetical protein
MFFFTFLTTSRREYELRPSEHQPSRRVCFQSPNNLQVHCPPPPKATTSCHAQLIRSACFRHPRTPNTTSPSTSFPEHHLRKPRTAGPHSEPTHSPPTQLPNAITNSSPPPIPLKHPPLQVPSPLHSLTAHIPLLPHRPPRSILGPTQMEGESC